MNKEKSNEISPGPMSVLRPALPYWVLGFGGVKHSSLMYCKAFPGFTRSVAARAKNPIGVLLNSQPPKRISVHEHSERSAIFNR